MLFGLTINLFFSHVFPKEIQVTLYKLLDPIPQLYPQRINETRNQFSIDESRISNLEKNSLIHPFGPQTNLVSLGGRTLVFAAVAFQNRKKTGDNLGQ